MGMKKSSVVTICTSPVSDSIKVESRQELYFMWLTNKQRSKEQSISFATRKQTRASVFEPSSQRSKIKDRDEWNILLTSTL